MLIPRIFRTLFRLPFFRKRYFGFYVRVFRPLNLFKNKTDIITYDHTLKIKLNINEWIQQQIYFLGYFDPAGINFMKKHTTEGATIIDIGANIGCYSLIASKVAGNNGKVIAFEAIPHVCRSLTENIELNKIKNVKIENLAIWEKNEMLTFYVASDENLGMSSVFRHDTESGNTLQIPAISLDNYLQSYPEIHPNLIKIDIEGSEYKALQGMVLTLNKYKPILFIEINLAVPDLIIDFLLRFGYEPFIIDEKGDLLKYGNKPSANYHNYVFIVTNADAAES